MRLIGCVTAAGAAGAAWAGKAASKRAPMSEPPTAAAPPARNVRRDSPCAEEFSVTVYSDGRRGGSRDSGWPARRLGRGATGRPRSSGRHLVGSHVVSGRGADAGRAAVPVDVRGPGADT